MVVSSKGDLQINVDASARDVNILGRGLDTSSHCPFKLYKYTSLQEFPECLVLSHTGNEDSCYGKHTMQVAVVNKNRGHPKGIIRRRSFFSERRYNDTERDGSSNVYSMPTGNSIKNPEQNTGKKTPHCCRRSTQVKV